MADDMKDEGNEQATVPKDIAQKIAEYLKSDDAKSISPWQRALYEGFLKSYGGGNSGFSNRYDKYYAPFLTGALSATKQDLLPNQYKTSSSYDTAEDSERKERFNEHLAGMSGADPFITAGGSGLGMLASSLLGGGIPGVITGLGIKTIAPAIWNKVKEHYANKRVADDMSTSFYRKLLRKNPTE